MPASNSKVENYSAKDEQVMLDTYNPKATQDERDAQVVEIAEKLDGRKPRSIIAKLSRMGVYVAKVRTTKTGAPVEHKKDIVADIAKAVGVSTAKLSSLTKATKADLQVLSAKLHLLEAEVVETKEVSS